MSVGLALPRSLIDPSPFQKELAAPGLKMEETARADGVDCDVLIVDEGYNQPRSRWTIGKADHLPRQIQTDVGIGGQLWVFKDVKLNHEVPADTFRVPTPTGFTFSGMNAPPPAAPAAAMPPKVAPITATPADPGAPRTRVVGAAVDDLAPDFELSTPKGEKIRLSSLRGNVVVLDFWGSWSLLCKKTAPNVQKLADDFKNQPVKVLAPAVREPNDQKPADYMADSNLTYTLLLRADAVSKEYRVKDLPTFFVIGKSGEIAHIETGFDPNKTFPALVQAIEIALGNAPTTIEQPPTKPTGETPKGDSPKGDK